MNIISTQYSLNNKAFEIYLSGCNGNCYGCHNPELKDFEIGEKYELIIPFIKTKISEFDSLIENIWILGGEPLDQNIDELIKLIKTIKTTNKKIWLFTRYELEQINWNVLKLCDFVKCGLYDESQKTDKNKQYNVNLATENQNIYNIS